MIHKFEEGHCVVQDPRRVATVGVPDTLMGVIKVSYSLTAPGVWTFDHNELIDPNVILVGPSPEDNAHYGMLRTYKAWVVDIANKIKRMEESNPDKSTRAAIRRHRRLLRRTKRECAAQQRSFTKRNIAKMKKQH